MQFVNDDMDELFRKAAEHYPLHTKTNDWDKVLEKMAQEEGTTGTRKQKGSAKWLLLLLPLFFICNRFAYVDHNAAVTPTKVTGERTGGAHDLKPAPRTTPAHNEGLKTSNTAVSMYKQETPKEIMKGSNYDVHDGITGANRVTGEKLSEKKKRTDARNISFGDNGSLPRITKPDSGNPGAPGISNPGIATDPEAGSNSRSEIAVSSDPGNKETSQEKSSLPIANSISRQEPGDNKQGKKMNGKINKKGAYAGVIAGPDFSSVRSSKSKGVGYSAGLIVGYNFSSRISLETGVYWDRKRYATTGKNFSTAKFNWPSHTNLLSISGYCDMIEIPLVVRFKQKTGNSGSVFVAAGASSYIMKKEDYQYTTERYGLYYSGNKSYTSGSTHLMPVVHFSAGYERTVKRIGNIRIEPYLKLPVAGVGIGDMSLKSSGVYLGITRQIR